MTVEEPPQIGLFLLKRLTKLASEEKDERKQTNDYESSHENNEEMCVYFVMIKVS